MERPTSRGSLGNRTRISPNKDPYRAPLAENLSSWRQPGGKSVKSVSNGKRTNDWDVSLERGYAGKADNNTEGLPQNKLNMASVSTALVENNTEDAFQEPREHDEDDDDEDTEMTTEEKRALFNAVGVGDIDLLEDLLDKPKADINAEWYGENLLMAAIRSGQTEMAEFLVDNGVDYNYQRKVIELEDKSDHKASVYYVGCRQMAYDKRLSNLVELIDLKNNDLFPFLKPRERQVRMRRPPKVADPVDPERACVEGADDEEATAASLRGVGETIKVPLRREPSESDSLRDNDTDSGHHSDISRREDIVDSPDTSFEHTKEDFRQGKSVPHDEGYCSISPLSSRRGSPTESVGNSKRAVMIKSTKSALGIKRETTKASDYKLREASSLRKEVNAAGSYSRERRLWTPKGKKGSSDTLENGSDDNPPALVRTQSPWQDDRPTNSRRHRRLPVPPTNNAQAHKPRIMSPPSQSSSRASKILSQTKIPTLPNKLSFPSLRSTIQATRIDVPGETLLEPSSKSPLRTQLKYGQSVTAADAHQARRYDEHFVINTELVKRKKSGYRS